MLGSVTSRATAQVLRLSLIYALLDLSPAIKLPHLEAALALWQYAEDSAKYIFGASLGDKIADSIIVALSACESGLTKTEISKALRGHSKGHEIDGALGRLCDSNRIKFTREKTNGTPITIYTLTDCEISELSEIRGREIDAAEAKAVQMEACGQL